MGQGVSCQHYRYITKAICVVLYWDFSFIFEAIETTIPKQCLIFNKTIKKIAYNMIKFFNSLCINNRWSPTDSWWNWSFIRKRHQGNLWKRSRIYGGWSYLPFTHFSEGDALRFLRLADGFHSNCVRRRIWVEESSILGGRVGWPWQKVKVTPCQTSSCV